MRASLRVPERSETQVFLTIAAAAAREARCDALDYSAPRHLHGERPERRQRSPAPGLGEQHHHASIAQHPAACTHEMPTQSIDGASQKFVKQGILRTGRCAGRTCDPANTMVVVGAAAPSPAASSSDAASWLFTTRSTARVVASCALSKTCKCAPAIAQYPPACSTAWVRCVCGIIPGT